MSNSYVGEIRLFAGNFAPEGWMLCEGQLLPISENETLFTLLGTSYGGDGVTTFGLPDLRGRVPVHMGGSYTLAQSGGVEQVTLTTQQIPAHTHGVPATGQRGDPASGVSGSGALANTGGTAVYTLSGGGTVDMASEAIAYSNGQNQVHNNMAPFLCVNFIISLFGVYPSPT